MKPYKVTIATGVIRHDEKVYRTGEIVELTVEQVEALKPFGVILAVNEDGDNTPPPNGGELIPAVAIAELFASAETPRDDKPSVKATQGIIKAQADTIANPETGQTWETVDLKITAALRDEAWKLYLAMPSEGDSTADSDEA